jgi:hypothetical protein
LDTEATAADDESGMETYVSPGEERLCSVSDGSDDNIVAVTGTDGKAFGKETQTDGSESQPTMSTEVEGSGATEERERRPCKLENGAVDNEDSDNTGEIVESR